MNRRIGGNLPGLTHEHPRVATGDPEQPMAIQTIAGTFVHRLPQTTGLHQALQGGPNPPRFVERLRQQIGTVASLQTTAFYKEMFRIGNVFNRFIEEYKRGKNHYYDKYYNQQSVPEFFFFRHFYKYPFTV